MAAIGSEVLGPVRIGGVGSAVRTLLPDALAALAAAHPRLVPTVVGGGGGGARARPPPPPRAGGPRPRPRPPRAPPAPAPPPPRRPPTVGAGAAAPLLPRLAGGELDLLLVESWAPRPLTVPEGITLRTLVSEEVYVALSAHHPLADRATLDLTAPADLGELADTAWACCPPGTEAYEALVQTLRARGIEPDIRHLLADHPTQLALVSRNLTACLAPAMSRRPAPPGVRFLPTRPALRRDIRVAWPARVQSPPVRACLSALATAVPGASKGEWEE
ncbi:LysR substrate-binding domain-containing protein [Streptomyces sp. NPDC059152]|uniref:LysR substrate-binding domain-containing protein n=1 Tax=Streptomyces sp. NPDC059152 TaxID=3346742 RepID=UPI0036C8F3A1